jgi:hypothetical protein
MNIPAPHAVRGSGEGTRNPMQPMKVMAEPRMDDAEAESFVIEAIQELSACRFPFLLAGTFAVSAYTGITRLTKDLDIFCKAGDAQRILAHFKSKDYSVTVEDERWLGKVHKGEKFFDVIFASANGTMPVGADWFDRARHIRMYGCDVQIVGPTDLVWSKCFIQLRHRYDGADVVHLILKTHDQIDWHQLLAHMEAHWEVLLVHLLNFRWIYPSERDVIPGWLVDELLDRLAAQRQLPASETKICRGRMFSRVDFEIDVREWGFADVVGDDPARNSSQPL